MSSSKIKVKRRILDVKKDMMLIFTVVLSRVEVLGLPVCEFRFYMRIA